jgi:hypothetical protein
MQRNRGGEKVRCVAEHIDARLVPGTQYAPINLPKRVHSTLAQWCSRKSRPDARFTFLWARLTKATHAFILTHCGFRGSVRCSLQLLRSKGFHIQRPSCRDGGTGTGDQRHLEGGALDPTSTS